MATIPFVIGMVLTSVLLVGSASAKLGGECDGTVDVNCDDYYQGEYVRHCLVSHMYLDLGHQVDGVVCEDQPEGP